MNRVVVTGARGFLGNACTDALRARGWEVVGVSSAATTSCLRVDLLDEHAVRSLMREVRPTHLLHAAWRPVHGDVMRSVDNLAWLSAGISLVKAFHESGGKRAAAIGTSAEYDWSGGVCRNTVTPLNPATLYGATKHALRIALEAYAKTVGLGFVWPRVFFVYGPGENETRLTASVIRSLVRGEPALCTHGEQVRDYLYVDDVARGIVDALESEHHGAIDIASGRGIAVRSLVQEAARALGREDLVRLGALPSPAHDVPLIVGDAAEAADELGWEPRIGLTDGIRKTVEWGRAVFGKS